MSADVRTYFWSAEQTDASNAPILEIGTASQQQFSFLKSVGLSVRCLWDEEPGAATPTDQASATSTSEPTTPPVATETMTPPAATETSTSTAEPSDPTPADTATATVEPTPTESGESVVYLPMAKRE